MEHRNEAISDLLLSRLPQPANLANYREQVASLLAKNEKELRQNKWTVRRVWIFVILVSIPCLFMFGSLFSENAPQANMFMGSVYFWVLFAAIEVAKYVDHEGRVELLKELKQLQLQVLELNSLFHKSGGAPTES